MERRREETSVEYLSYWNVSLIGSVSPPPNARQYPPSCFRLGSFFLRHYKRHEGYEKDAKKAEAHMKAGCDLGHPTSCHTLAAMYKNGDGAVKRDEALFLKYKELTEKLVGQAKMRFNASSGR